MSQISIIKLFLLKNTLFIKEKKKKENENIKKYTEIHYQGMCYGMCTGD